MRADAARAQAIVGSAAGVVAAYALDGLAFARAITAVPLLVRDIAVDAVNERMCAPPRAAGVAEPHTCVRACVRAWGSGGGDAADAALSRAGTRRFDS